MFAVPAAQRLACFLYRELAQAKVQAERNSAVGAKEVRLAVLQFCRSFSMPFRDGDSDQKSNN
jgi:hypothetical protein